MANLVDSQGTKVYLVPVGTVIATAENVATAIASAKEFKCFQNFGDVGVTYNVQEYKCLDQNDVKKSRGSISLGNIPVEFLFNSADVDGQEELRLIADSGDRKICIVKYNDQITPSTGNPSYRTFETFVSSDMETIAIDAAIIAKFTLELASKPVRIKAV